MLRPPRGSHALSPAYLLATAAPSPLALSTTKLTPSSGTQSLLLGFPTNERAKEEFATLVFSPSFSVTAIPSHLSLLQLELSFFYILILKEYFFPFKQYACPI